MSYDLQSVWTSREEIRRKLDAIHALSGIGKYFNEPVKYYSSGMGSRLGFALSMAFDFDYFLIDEVTLSETQFLRRLRRPR